MTDELQRLVDALAARLGRAVVLEDRRQRMVTYSQHGEPLDAVRRDSILQRQTTSEVITWLRGFGIVESAEPVRVPGNAALGLLPRVCVPVRHSDLLLGFLWFIDAGADMPDAEVALAARSAPDFALALYRENLLGELSQRREAEGVRLLLGGDAPARGSAAEDLIDQGAFLPRAGVVALVAWAEGRQEGAGDAVRLALEQSLVAARRRVPPRHALHLLRHDHGVLLAAVGGAAQTLDVAGHARHLVQALERALPPEVAASTRLVVGVGEEQPELAQAHRSFDQARQAAHVAARLPGTGPVAEWRELGVYRALARLSEEEAGAGLLHPGLLALLGLDEEQTLARTLEAYLDRAGNAQATAAALSLHRATLYYRLQRVQDVTGADLRDGTDRLTLHLGLKLARLDGRYRAAPAP